MSSRHPTGDHRRRGVLSWLLLFVGGFVLAAMGAAFAYFLVTVLDTSGNNAIATGAKLSSPTGAQVTELSATKVKVSWANPGSQLTGAHYIVIETSSTQVCSVSETATSCTVTGLAAGTTYTFAVMAAIGTHWRSATTKATFKTLKLTTTSLPNGTVGTHYTTSLAATGGVTPYTHWAYAGGSTSLPGGLTLTTTTGTISGTPTTAGTTTGLKFTVTDAKGAMVNSGTLSLTIKPGQANTTTTLTLTSPLTYGAENLAAFHGTVTGQTNDGYPEGKVIVKQGSTKVCTATLSGGSGDTASYSCTLTAKQLTASGTAYSMTATFTPGAPSSSSPNWTYKTSTSTPATALTVSPEPENTTTSLTLSKPSVTYTAETSVTFHGTVTGQTNDGYPNGTVAVRAGTTTLCVGTLGTGSGDVSKFKCTTTAIKLNASAIAYTITAHYTGGASSITNYVYNPSPSSGQPLTVNPKIEGTTTSLSLSSPITYGSEHAESFTGMVTGQGSDGYPKGTITVKVGSTVLCTESLPAGSGDVSTYACSPSNTALTTGTFTVKAYFTPATPSSFNTNYAYTASTSSKRPLKVDKANTSFSITVTGGSSATITAGTQATLAETGLPGGSVGTVTFYRTSGHHHALCTTTLPAKTCTTSATLGAGTYTITAVYSGNTNYNGSTSTNTVSLKVVVKAEGLSITGQSGDIKNFTCAKPAAGAVHCTATFTQNNGTFAAKVDFVTATGSPVVYSTTQASQIEGTKTHAHTITGFPLTVPAGHTTTSGSFTATESGNSGIALTIWFGNSTVNKATFVLYVTLHKQ